MITFPEWSDLGGAQPDRTSEDNWNAMLMDLNRREYYFSGQVFKETVPGEYSEGEEPPLMFPIGMNIVKSMVLAHTDAMFGEHEGTPIQFAVREDLEETAADRAAIDLLTAIFEHNNMASTLWETELDRNKFGGGAIRVNLGYSNATQPHERVRITRVQRHAYFPVFDPEDANRLLKLTTVVHLSPEQVYEKYGTKAERDVVTRAEVWTLRDYKTYIDGKINTSASGANPWGIIPSIYIPRYRSSNPLGDCLVDDLIPVQDDFNARAADISEAINYGAHPILTGVNLPRGFNADNFPLGSGAMWDLGKSIGGYEPKVAAIEMKNVVQPGTMDFVNLIYSWAEVAGETPPIAFGKDDGGGQRSGITLELRMWPLLKAIRRSRNYLHAGIRGLIRTIGIILAQKKYSDVPVRAVESILAGRIVPVFHPTMPRDQQALVDEVQKLLSTEPPAISIETAQKILGRGPAEVTRILSMLENRKYWDKNEPEEAPPVIDGMNKENIQKEAFKEDERPDLKEKRNG